MEDFMDLEIHLGLVYLNDSDNSKILSKWPNQNQIDKWMYSYQSTAHIVERNCWFFDYLYNLFNIMVNDRDLKLSEIGAKAYDIAIAPHHNWIL